MKKSFIPLSFQQLSEKFNELAKHELKTYGAEDDITKLPLERREQFDLIDDTYEVLKKNLKMKDEEKELILRGVMLYVKYNIGESYAKSFSRYIPYLKDPNRSDVYRLMDQKLGATPENLLDLTSQKDALRAFRKFFEDNLNNEACFVSRMPNRLEIFGKISHYLNPALNDISAAKMKLHAIPANWQGPVKPKPELYDELKNFNHKNLHHVEVAEKERKIPLKIFKKEEVLFKNDAERQEFKNRCAHHKLFKPTLRRLNTSARHKDEDVLVSDHLVRFQKKSK